MQRHCNQQSARWCRKRIHFRPLIGNLVRVCGKTARIVTFRPSFDKHSGWRNAALIMEATIGMLDKRMGRSDIRVKQNGIRLARAEIQGIY